MALPVLYCLLCFSRPLCQTQRTWCFHKLHSWHRPCGAGLLYRVAQKTSWTFARRVQQSSWNESAQKHVCNEQTSSNMSRNSCLKNFRISCGTNKIVLHVIKQYYARGKHLYCRSYTHYAGYTRTSQWSTNQQKMCWIGPPFCCVTAAKRIFHCNIAFLTVWLSTTCQKFLITFWRSFTLANGSRLPS